MADTGKLARNLARDRLILEGSRRRRTVSSRQLALRRIWLLAAKLGLPLVALALLSLVVLWPELARVAEGTRLSFRRAFSIEAESGRMLDPHYRGVDERGRPYTMTAKWAAQDGPNRVDLGDPTGDIMLENGTWMQVAGRDGVYLQHTEELDLSHDVVLYRDDGTTLHTQAAAVDLKQGAASSSDQTHAEGPFGTLDAQGFTLLDKGAAIQFQGPARLVLDADRSAPPK